MFKHVRFIEVEDEYTKLSFVQKDEEVKVIRFDKPIAVLISQDETKIDELISLQDERIACEVITIDEFKALVQTTGQYLRACEAAETKLNSMMENIEKNYPQKERETWSIQKDEATKYLASKNENDAPFLKVLATAENDSIDNFANAVLIKNEAFTILSANALREKRAVKNELLSEWGI